MPSQALSRHKLPQKVMQQLGSTYRALVAGFDARTGQSAPRWRILVALYDQDGCSQKQLSAELRMDPAALTRQLKTMQDKGWVSRQADPQDNRLSNVSITAAGRREVERVAPARTAFFHEVFEGMSQADMQTLHELLAQLQGRAQACSDPVEARPPATGRKAATRRIRAAAPDAAA